MSATFKPLNEKAFEKTAKEKIEEINGHLSARLQGISLAFAQKLVGENEEITVEQATEKCNAFMNMLFEQAPINNDDFNDMLGGAENALKLFKGGVMMD